MDLNTQGDYLLIIADKFQSMYKMLKEMEGNIIQYPVFTQLEFLKPLEAVLIEALKDSRNEKDDFLNNYDGGDDKISIDGK